MKLDRKIHKEVVYLYILQISNMLLPFLSLPILTNSLGVELFGKLSFSQAVALIAIFIVDFGFNFSGAKRISDSGSSNENISIIYSNVQFIKTFVFFIVMFFSIIISFLYSDPIDKTLLLLGCLTSSSSIFLSGWLFQGLAKNSVIAFVSLITRLVCTAIIYIYVSGKQDFYIACFLQLMPPVISGIIIQFFISFFTPIKLRIVYIKKENIKSLFKDSFDNFSASFITLGFTYFNPLLVKYFFGDSALGIYSLADKLVNVLRQFYSPIVQAFFSQICGFLQSKNIVKYQQTIKKVFCFYCFISISALLFNEFLGVFFLENFFARGFSSDLIAKVHLLIRLMIITQFIISMSIIAVNLTIIPLGLSYFLKKGYLLGLALYVVLLYPMLNYFGLVGINWALIMVELALLIVFVSFIRKNFLVHVEAIDEEK